MTNLHTENARLRAALAYMVNHAKWREENEGVYWEATKIARAALATPAPDAVQEAAISEVVQHESTRRWFHGEATHEEIMECVKAMDAAVAKWRAIAGDRT